MDLRIRLGEYRSWSRQTPAGVPVGFGEVGAMTVDHFYGFRVIDTVFVGTIAYDGP